MARNPHSKNNLPAYSTWSVFRTAALRQKQPFAWAVIWQRTRSRRLRNAGQAASKAVGVAARVVRGWSGRNETPPGSSRTNIVSSSEISASDDRHGLRICGSHLKRIRIATTAICRYTVSLWRACRPSHRVTTEIFDGYSIRMIAASPAPAGTTSPTRFPNIDLASGETCENRALGRIGFVLTDDPECLLPAIVAQDRHRRAEPHFGAVDWGGHHACRCAPGGPVAKVAARSGKHSAIG